MKKKCGRAFPGLSRIFFVVPALFLLLLCSCPTSASLYRDAFERYTAQDNPKALEILARIIQSDPSYTPAYILESVIRLAQNELERAAAVLADAKEKAQPSAAVCFNLGNVFFRQGNYPAAFAEFSIAIELDPELAEAWLNRANTRMALKEYRAALGDYEMFLKLSEKERPEVRQLVELLRRDFGN